MRAVKPLVIALITLSGIGLVAYMLTKPVVAAQPDITPSATPTSSTDTRPGTGLFAAISVDIDLSDDVQNTIDVRQHSVENDLMASGCFAATEVVYLGRGGEDMPLGNIYRCSEAVWNASSIAQPAKVIMSNGADAIIFVANPAAPLEEISPVEAEYNEIFNLLQQSDIYKFQ
ncbi:MAG: hypothetical protein RIS75_748 [Actinomycetota bacterium]|jgi:hypothetical protein